MKNKKLTKKEKNEIFNKTKVSDNKYICSQCELCGYKMFWHIKNPNKNDIAKHIAFTIDHKVPKSKNGTNVISNLRYVHAICNTYRGNEDKYTKNEYRKKMENVIIKQLWKNKNCYKKYFENLDEFCHYFPFIKKIYNQLIDIENLEKEMLINAQFMDYSELDNQVNIDITYNIKNKI